MGKKVEEGIAGVQQGRVLRGRVRTVRADGLVVIFADAESKDVACEILQVSGPPNCLARGDDVLVWRPGPGEQGVVLGRIGVDANPGDSPRLPDELLLEAKNGLTLRVGDGSITLRADGKILIKGKDLVSHAKRLNRIKGGAVSIN
ncbi:MAG TPA: hypothetical protein VMR54_11115 [Thermoanaerobaculia bacterium]|nr:hypothetical protein [Thermoanaerobaculia bacterium]